MPGGFRVLGGTADPLTIGTINATTLVVAGVFSMANGSIAAPSIALASETNSGFYAITGFGAGIGVSSAGAWSCSLGDSTNGRGVTITAAGLIVWSSGTVPGNPVDTYIGRLAPASVRIGSIPSATPVAQTLTLGEASRPGTDTNIAGAAAVIRTGLGTGTGTPATGSLQGPIVAASGSSTQTYGTVVQWTGTKLGLYGKTPVVQAATIAVDGGGAVACVASGAATLQVKLDAVIVALTNLGILT